MASLGMERGRLKHGVEDAPAAAEDEDRTYAADAAAVCHQTTPAGGSCEESGNGIAADEDLEDALEEANGDSKDTYAEQLEVVRRLHAAGAGTEGRRKAAAARLAELKRASWVPKGTVQRKKKRVAGGEGAQTCNDENRDAAAAGPYTILSSAQLQLNSSFLSNKVG